MQPAILIWLIPKLQLSPLYTSQGKPEKPSFRQGCRNPVHGRYSAGCASAWFSRLA